MDFIDIILELKKRFPWNFTQKERWYHGILTHTVSVIKRAIEIYEKDFNDTNKLYNKKPDVMMAIIIASGLHDSWRVQDYWDKEHAGRWVENFKIFLNVVTKDSTIRRKIGKEYQKEIEHAIKYHSDSKVKPESIIDICLWDADRVRLSNPDTYDELYFHSKTWKKMAKENKAFY